MTGICSPFLTPAANTSPIPGPTPKITPLPAANPPLTMGLTALSVVVPSTRAYITEKALSRMLDGNLSGNRDANGSSCMVSTDGQVAQTRREDSTEYGYTCTVNSSSRHGAQARENVIVKFPAVALERIITSSPGTMSRSPCVSGTRLDMGVTSIRDPSDRETNALVTLTSIGISPHMSCWVTNTWVDRRTSSAWGLAGRTGRSTPASVLTHLGLNPTFWRNTVPALSTLTRPPCSPGLIPNSMCFRGRPNPSEKNKMVP